MPARVREAYPGAARCCTVCSVQTVVQKQGWTEGSQMQKHELAAITLTLCPHVGVA